MFFQQDFFPYKKGRLFAENVNIDKIARDVGTPTYVYSENALRSAVRRLREAFQESGATAHFAMKSNSNLSVLNIMREEGCGVDIVSGGEFAVARWAGFDPSQIVFSGVGKSTEEITMALASGKRGVGVFNVESVPELEMIQTVARKLKRRARIAFRFNPDVDAKTHPSISTGLKHNKFGLNRSEILDVTSNWKPYGWLDPIGLSVHIGSQILSLRPFQDAFIRVRALADLLRNRFPLTFRSVDIGGGIGVRYHDENPIDLNRYAQVVEKTFGNYKISLEPGRLLSANAGILVSKVILRKTRSGKDFLILDAAMNDLMRPALYESYHHIVPVRKAAGSTKATDIVGPVCESTDVFCKNRKFPTVVKAGDLVAVLSAGAYGFSMSSTYNCRPRPAEVMACGKSFHIVRKREDYRDLIKKEIAK